MFLLASLPKVSFFGPEHYPVLDLAKSGDDIQRVAEMVAKSMPPSAAVGLIFSTGPDLIISWLGVVAAGRVPLILQYPNEKSSNVSWRESLRSAILSCDIKLMLCASCLSTNGLEVLGPCTYLRDLFTREANDSQQASRVIFPLQGEILQLSSGTTGTKKPIRFSFASLQQHASLYNARLRLTHDDRIVSWLPLYHDMGFIACFVMPLLLGVPFTLLDPISWVKHPELLFEAIVRDTGTICFMPNFGFEVMAKIAVTQSFPCMRQWISCSEPSYPETVEHFLNATGTNPSRFATCYGMAENVFAITQSDGFRLIEHEKRRYVSCGPPIAGTEIKLVNREFFVRSPHALVRYENEPNICDSQGYYATGDVGFLDAGEVVITGRKLDIAMIAGCKHQLNDLDFAAGKIFPKAAGRIACLAPFDTLLGTERVVVLVEDSKFWQCRFTVEEAASIRQVTGIEYLEIHFVPPRFITKTSSGKINRIETLKHWQACSAASCIRSKSERKRDFASALSDSFPGVPTDRPVNEVLDSLGLMVLRLLCEEYGVPYSALVTLSQVDTRETGPVHTLETEVFSIIALVDGWRLGFEAPSPVVDDDFLEAIAAAVGCPVHVEHICAPPLPILFSDLVFNDYFLPKHPYPGYRTVSSLLTKISEASLILVDDEDNFRTPPFCAYPVLDHQFVAHSDARLLGHRMQRYTQDHQHLARNVVLGNQIKPGDINASIADMEEYLRIPVMRIAHHAAYRPFTDKWECRAYEEFGTDADKIGNEQWPVQLRLAILNFIETQEARLPGAFRRRPGIPVNRFVLIDSPHFCSFLLNPVAVDYVVNKYQSFCIVGLPSSLPYLQQQLNAAGKPYFFSSEVVPHRKDYECLLLTGGVGGRMPVTDKPTFDFVHAREEGHGGGRPHNVSIETMLACPPLAACDEQLFRTVRETQGVLIGNYLLNNTTRSNSTE